MKRLISVSCILLLLATGMVVAAELPATGTVSLDVCHVGTGQVQHLVLPASQARSLLLSNMPPSPRVLHDPTLSARARLLFANRSRAIDRPAKSRTAVPPAKIGNYHAIVLLVDFSDNLPQSLPGLQAERHYNDMLFSLGTYPTGSLRDYYQENSYHQLDVTGVASGGPTGWYRAPQTYAYYVDNNYGESDYPRNAPKLVEDLVNLADPYVDFSLYDNDHDGFVDSLFVVHAGPGAEATGSPHDIWSHTWSLNQPVTVDGVKASDYSIEPETGNIGVFCHEYGHILGAYDLYDYGNNVVGYDSAGVGVWTVMAAGSWGGDYNSDDRPVQFDPWHKILFGWIKPKLLTAGQNGVSFPDVEHNPVVYKVWKPGAMGNEYLLIENRQKQGFDALLYGSGLLVYHVDDSKFQTTVNDDEWYPGTDPTRHYAVAVEQADARWDLEHNFNVGDAGDPFPGTANNRAFSFGTTPDSDSYLSGPSGVQINSISDSGSTMSANIALTMPAHVTWYVRAEAVGNGDGTSPQTAFATINQALAAGKSGDTILVGPGVYAESLNFGGKDLALTGSNPDDPGAVAATIVRGPVFGATVSFTSHETAAAVLRGLTITHLPGVTGAGLTISGAAPTIEHCVIRDNVIDLGDQRLSHGGGVQVFNGARPLITDCTVTNNIADYGAGISVVRATPMIQDTIFTTNRATYDGGGLYLLGCKNAVTVDNCQFTGDEARRGGGLLCNNSSPLVTGCRFEACAARNDGGAIHLRSGSNARISRVTISKCSAFLYDTSSGAGIFCIYSSSPSIDRATIYDCTSPEGAGLEALYASRPSLTNSIIARCGGPGVEADQKLPITYCDVWGNHGRNFAGFLSPAHQNGNINVPPQFANSGNGDFHLKSTAGRFTEGGWVRDTVTSPCIDAGDPATPVGQEPQPNGGRVNMGADGGSDQASMSPATEVIASVSPASGATDVPRNAVVTVHFRVAMDEASVAKHFQLVGQALSPMGSVMLVSGTTTWTDPGLVMQFMPSQPLDGGRRYTGTIASGVAREDDSVVNWAESFSFAVGQRPAVLAVTPTGNRVYRDLPVTITFDQPMNKQSAQQAFAISPNVAGTFTWPQATQMVFRPTHILASGATYTVTLAAAAKSANGPALGQDYAWQFTTLPGGAPAAVMATAAATPNGGAQITVNLTAAATVGATITNIAGTTVAILPAKPLAAGVTALLWDGKSRTGTKVVVGQYLVRVQAIQADGTTSNCLTGLRR